MFWSVNVKIWLIFHLFDFFARITLDIVTYDVVLGNGYILLRKLKLYGQNYMSFKDVKDQVEGMVKMG